VNGSRGIASCNSDGATLEISASSSKLITAWMSHGRTVLTKATVRGSYLVNNSLAGSRVKTRYRAWKLLNRLAHWSRDLPAPATRGTTTAKKGSPQPPNR